MKAEDYNFSKNGIKISFDDFLLELRKQYKTEKTYKTIKKKLLNKMKKGIYGWNSTSMIHLKITRKKTTCPLCNKEIVDYPALSRRDNKTEICNNCGILEALEDFIRYRKREI